jgi:hypothetical protein
MMKLGQSKDLFNYLLSTFATLRGDEMYDKFQELQTVSLSVEMIVSSLS